MPIRLAALADAPGIARLLTQLGYPGTEAFLAANLEKMLADPNEVPLVWADESSIAGFLSMSFSVYPGVRGPVVTIKSFTVDENARSRGIGAQLEAEVTRRAREKGCDRIILHCAERRTRAHEFYYRQGYVESPKYLIKRL
jgi:GNAT superfamily N-acetyltransferase